MKTGVDYNPWNEKSGKRSHKSFLSELPRIAEVFFIHLLKVRCVDVYKRCVHHAEAEKVDAKAEIRMDM